MKKLNYLFLAIKEKVPSTKTIVILFLMAHTVLATMLLYTFPIIHEQIGVKAFDLRSFGYSYQEALAILHRLDYLTLQVYLFPQLFFLDILYPLLLALFLNTFLRRLYHLTFGTSLLILKIISILPLIAMVCDYIENLFIAWMIVNTNSITEFLVATSSLFTILKSSFTTISWAIILVFAIKWILLKNRQKVKYASNN